MAAGLIIALNPLAQIQKANDAKRKADLSSVQKVLEQYYQDQSQYPEHVVVASDYFIKTTDARDPIKEWGTSWLPYMGNLPSDPSSSKRYIYVSTGQAYYLYGSLDRGINDMQICKSDGSKCDNAPAQARCGANAVCNYGVSSSNVSP